MNPYNYFPVSYQTNPYMQNYQQQQAALQQQYQQQMQQQQQPQALNGGYVTVRSEEEARSYPVAPGASVTFFNETEPYCYKKSAGTSPLDPPTFEIYQITKVEAVSNVSPTKDIPERKNEQIDGILCEIEVLHKQVSELQEKYNSISSKECVSNVKSVDKQSEK